MNEHSDDQVDVEVVMAVGIEALFLSSATEDT